MWGGCLMDWSSISAVASAGIALVAVLLSIFLYRSTRRADDKRGREQRMPVLVPYLMANGTIEVTNVGTGPAMNIFLAIWESPDPDRRIPLDVADAVGGTWFNPVHLRQIPAGGMQVIPAEYRARKPDNVRSYGIAYTDPFMFRYFTKTSDRGTMVREGTEFPQWPDDTPYPEWLPGASRWP